MTRAVWKGTVTFGLVTFPVRVTVATDDLDVRFHLIHRACGTQIKQLKFCPSCETLLGADEIGRAWKPDKDTLVPVDDETFDNLPLPGKSRLQVKAFVPAQEFDVRFIEKVYYLEPDAGGEHAYAVLADVLYQDNVAGLAEVTMRERYRFCAISALSESTLVLVTLRFSDEVRAAPATSEQVSREERAMARKLIQTMTTSFTPEMYRDPYRDELMRRLQDRAPTITPVTTEEATEPTSLLEQLQQSLRQAIEQKKRAAP